MAVATAAGSRLFDYTGVGTAGNIVKGRLEASSEGSVADRLRQLGLAPLEVKEVVAGTGLRRELSLASFGRGVDLGSLAVFSRQLATMIGAGISLIKSLGILNEQTENKKLANVLVQVTRDVETGGSLSGALAKHPQEFPPLMINMIKAGEAGGFLERALDSVAGNFEKEVKLRSTIKSAMAYPVVVLAMSFLGVIAMLLFIVPVFKNMFASLGSALPVPTQILVDISDNMWWFTPLLAIAIVAFVLWWRVNKNTDRVRAKVDPFKLKIPIFGELNRKIAIARFTRNFANMLAAGVPLMQALLIVGETSGNYVLEQAARNIADAVRQGKSIGSVLSEEPVFPPMAVQMITVGEDSGSLETMLHKVADFMDAEVESTTKALTSLIEPLLIAVLGVVIGGMIIALYMPIFSIATAVQNQGG